jgi:redox-sensitive bicupin YhaK (pirin superfamily)
MLVVRRDAQIFSIDGGWFQARWHFSFDTYRDPENMGWGPLRVFNDDRLIPGAIWPLHPHRDIEGLTYVVEGTFSHEDDHGGNGVLPAGSVQRMTLGSGAMHSEQNGSETEPMRFIQMWILPDQLGLPPSVEQKVFTPEQRTDGLLEVFSPQDGDAVKIHGDAFVYIARLNPEVEVEHSFASGRGAYLYLIEGALVGGDEKLATGDAVKIRDEPAIRLRAEDTSELILVDVPLD